MAGGTLSTSKTCPGNQIATFMLLKEYWFRELYLSLKVTASFDRTESYVRVIDGQVRCITPDFKNQDLHVAWNVQYVVIFVPAWMIPPMYHSLRRESVKSTDSGSVTGVKKRRAQICGQIQRFIKISTELRRQTRTSTTHTKHKRSACSRKPN